jgi:hypothetical protein
MAAGRTNGAKSAIACLRQLCGKVKNIARYNHAHMRCVRFVILAIACAACAHAQKHDFDITQSLRLNEAENGIDGALQVLTDSRLSSELQKQMWGVGDWSFVLPQGDARRAEFKQSHPKNAQLRIVTDTGLVLRDVSLEQPLARITEAHLWNGKTSFFVAVDYSVGFGSYAGVTTLLLYVVDRQFQWARATSADAQESEQIRLPDTLKSAWKLVPFQGKQDILLAYCRPAKVQVPGRDFVVGYVRYRVANPVRKVEFELLQLICSAPAEGCR